MQAIVGEDGEIVGLHLGTNGRSCECHSVCGLALRVGDVVRFKRDVATDDESDGEEYICLKAMKIFEGVQQCFVGFIPRAVVTFGILHYEDKCAQILELYSSSDEYHLKNRSARNKGMASFRLFEYVPFNN